MCGPRVSGSCGVGYTTGGFKMELHFIFITLIHLWVLSNQSKHAKCIIMINNGASFKIWNFMAF